MSGRGTEPERAAQRRGLLGRQAVELAEDRTQQLVQASPGERGLEFRSAGPEHGQPAVGSGRRGVVEQRGLPQPGRPGHQQQSSVTAADAIERLRDPAAFPGPPDQHTTRLDQPLSRTVGTIAWPSVARPVFPQIRPGPGTSIVGSSATSAPRRMS